MHPSVAPIQLLHATTSVLTRRRLQNTQCDNCIIGTMIAAQYLACCCWVGDGDGVGVRRCGGGPWAYGSEDAAALCRT